MKRPIFFPFLFFFLVFSICLTAQTNNERNAVKGMCGCFEVTFEYAETFPRDTAYERREPYHATALEYVVADEDTPEKIVLQHLLVINDSLVIKHWRQDWEYQPTRVFSYAGDRVWTSENTDKRQVRGAWAQKVYEVDDSPRYSSIASWVFQRDQTYWEAVADAPLPRREYTKRSDYNILRRDNRHQLTSDGWLHEQDNEKIQRTAAGDRILVEEKGRNLYRRTDVKRCAQAQAWWNQHRGFWVQVRGEWNDILAEHDQLALARQVDGKYLGQELDGLSTQIFRNNEDCHAAIRNTIARFMQAK